jgi:hypothetical protein
MAVPVRRSYYSLGVAFLPALRQRIKDKIIKINQ